jgi:hypothetical protein
VTDATGSDLGPCGLQRGSVSGSFIILSIATPSVDRYSRGTEFSRFCLQTAGFGRENGEANQTLAGQFPLPAKREFIRA